MRGIDNSSQPSQAFHCTTIEAFVSNESECGDEPREYFVICSLNTNFSCECRCTQQVRNVAHASPLRQGCEAIADRRGQAQAQAV